MQRNTSKNTIRNYQRKVRKRGFSCINLCEDWYLLPSSLGGHSTIEGCYASSLGNCIGPISREHYISESILSKCDTAEASGGAFPWLKASRIPPKQVFVANCLCTFHNNFLSPLDSLADQVFENFKYLLDKSHPILLIWGPSLARWYLKCLIGLVCSKQVSSHEKIISLEDIPSEWIDILFGRAGFEPGQGLYMTPVIGTSFRVETRICVETLFLGKYLSGIRITLAGVEFILSMEVDSRKAFKVDHPAFKNILYSPKQFNLDWKTQYKLFW